MKKDNIIDLMNSEETQISLSDVILIIVSNIRVIVFIPLILCFISIVYVQFFATPIYTSTAKIFSSSTNQSLSQAAGLAAQFGISLPVNSSETKWSYLEILKSQTFAKKILERQFFSKEHEKKLSLLKILTFGNQKPSLSFAKYEDMALRKLDGMVKVSEDVKTRIFTISVSFKDPKLASEINNVFIEELNEHQYNYNKSKTSETRNFIENRISQTKLELQDAEEKLKNFMDRNRRIENSPALQLEKQRLDREVDVLTSVFTTLKQNLETVKIEEVKESKYVMILDSPNIPISYSWPKKRIVVFTFGFIGIILGIAIGFMNEYKKRIKKSEKNKFKRAKAIFFENITKPL